MRIISGEFRRRLLLSPRDSEKTRPIPDRVKESLFSLLRGHFENATVFDGFAGVGTIGLEAISRGASRCVMVERDRDIAELLRQNVASLGVEDRSEVFIGDALGAAALARCPRPVHLVFFDPPYAMLREPIGYRRVTDQLSKLIDLLDDTGFAVFRTPWPLRHWAPDPNSPNPAPADAPPSKQRRRGGKRDALGSQESWLHEAAPRTDEEFDDVGELEDEEAAELEALEHQSAGQWAFVDLKLPGAQGPETHVYHSMAVHLYMKKKAANTT